MEGVREEGSGRGGRVWVCRPGGGGVDPRLHRPLAVQLHRVRDHTYNGNMYVVMVSSHWVTCIQCCI